MNEYLASASMAIHILKWGVALCFAAALIFACLFGSVKPMLKASHRRNKRLREALEKSRVERDVLTDQVGRLEKVIESLGNKLELAEGMEALAKAEATRQQGIRFRTEEALKRRNAEEERERSANLPILREVVKRRA